MATRNRLSFLLESLLLTTLVLCFSFSSCNATSRNMARTVLLERGALPCSDAAPAHSSANSCAAERESSQARSTTAVEQGLPNMQHPAEFKSNRMSSMDSAGTVAKMANHDDEAEWVRNSEHKNMMDGQNLRDSNTHSEDQTSSMMRDSDRMRESDSKWMSDAGDRHMTDLQKMRDPRIDRMSDSERINYSEDTMSDIDKRIRNPQRLWDTQSTIEESKRAVWSTEKMRDIESGRSSIRDSDRSSALESASLGSARMRDSERSTMDTGMMVNLDGVRDSQRMIESGPMMRNSHQMIDLDGMRDSQKMIDSDSMRDSQMMDSDGLRDSQNMRTSDKMYPRQSSDEMLNSESKRLRDSNQMMNQDRLGESAENLRNSQWRSADIGNAHHDQQSEMLQDSQRMSSHGRRDLENTRAAGNYMMDSAAAQNNNIHGEMGQGSEMMRDAQQVNRVHRRGDLEGLRNADDVQSSEQSSADSHRMRSRPTMQPMMERQHSSMSMKASSCQGTDCRSTSNHNGMESRAMEHEAMPLRPRRSDAEITPGSQWKNSENSMGSSTAAKLTRCSGLNAADCDAAIDGELAGSRNMHTSQRDDSSNSCRLGALDCGMTNMKREADVNSPRSMEMERSATGERMSSCNNGNCHASIAHNNGEQAMADRQQQSRNDPEWVRAERRTSTINEGERMDNSQNISPMATQGMARSADEEAMQLASRERHLGESIDAERRTSNMMRGSEMQRSISNHWTRSTAEIITGPSSCTNAADCQRTSGIMHMGPRDSELMGQSDEQINDQSSCAAEAGCQSTSGIMHMSPRDSENLMGQSNEQIMNGQSSCTNGAHCRSTSGIMHMSPRDSELMGQSDEQIIGRTSCINGADCLSTSGIMHKSTRDSEMMGRNLHDQSGMTRTGKNWSSEINGDLMMDQEMKNNSKMMPIPRESDQMNASAEMMQHNSDEAAADDLPIHRGN